MSTPTDTNAPLTQQRIDKWLWCARFYKTRSLAAKVVNNGTVKVTRGEEIKRVSKASFTIQNEDILTFTKDNRVRIIHVLSTATRRGPAPEAQQLYEDMSPPPPEKTKKPVDPFAREPGAGRPTKKDRRRLEAVRKGDV